MRRPAIAAATATVALAATLAGASRRGGRALTGWEHYHERYVRTAEGWRIAEQKLTRLHMDFDA